MFFAKFNLMKYFIIIYLCAFLTGVPFAASSFAKIMIKNPNRKEMEVITIEKGDSLWDLAEKYFDAPFKWKEFREYNIYTNPNLIYPGENMQIPVSLARSILKSAQVDVQAEMSKFEELREMREEIDEKLKELEMSIAQLEANTTTKSDFEEIQEGIKDLQEQLGFLASQPTANVLNLQKVTMTITEKVKKNDEKVTNIEERMDGLEEPLKQGEKNIQQVQDKLSEIDVNIQALQMGIDKNRMAITKLRSMLQKKGMVIKPESKDKRVFAFITTALAAVAWFAVNSYSHPD